MVQAEFAECELPISIEVRQRKVPETSGMETTKTVRFLAGCQIIHAICRRSCGNATKTEPKSHVSTCRINWGWTKGERQMTIAVELKYLPCSRNVHSSLRMGRPFTWRRDVVVAAKIEID